MSNKPINFLECLQLCAGNKELVSEFDRLTGSNLSLRGSPIDVMIDQASGRTETEIEAFIQFVHEFIWIPTGNQEANNK